VSYFKPPLAAPFVLACAAADPADPVDAPELADAPEPDDAPELAELPDDPHPAASPSVAQAAATDRQRRADDPRFQSVVLRIPTKLEPTLAHS
jgi:hypothetical protein